MKKSCSPALTYTQVRDALHVYKNPAKAHILRQFFKTGPGEYGEGDVFLGITVPQVRGVVKEYPACSLTIAGRFMRSRFHEERLLGLLLLDALFARADAAQKKAIFNFYMAHRAHINNWDLVDLTAPTIVGAYLAGRSTSVLYRLARSRSLWDRRIAIVATHFFIRNKSFADTLTIADMLIRDEHDLIHKAVGWMLRELGKRDHAALVSFLRPRYRTMPRTMLRYAIERFPAPERRAYMSK